MRCGRVWASCGWLRDTRAACARGARDDACGLNFMRSGRVWASCDWMRETRAACALEARDSICGVNRRVSASISHRRRMRCTRHAAAAGEAVLVRSQQVDLGALRAGAVRTLQLRVGLGGEWDPLLLGVAPAVALGGEWHLLQQERDGVIRVRQPR